MSCHYIRDLSSAASRDDAADAAALEKHLSSCKDCRHSWDETERLTTLPDPAAECWSDWSQRQDEHLDSQEIWTLVEYQGGELQGRERSLWQHLLGCRSCYKTVSELRSAWFSIEETEDKPPRVLADDIWTRREVKRLIIACVWAGTEFGVHGVHGVHGIRHPVRRSRQKEKSPGPVEIEHSFPPYHLAATLLPDAADKTCRIDLTLSSPKTLPEGLRASLYRENQVMQSRLFRHGQIRFPAQPAGDYRIDIADGEGETIAVIDMPIGIESGS